MLIARGPLHSVPSLTRTGTGHFPTPAQGMLQVCASLRCPPVPVVRVPSRSSHNLRFRELHYLLLYRVTAALREKDKNAISSLSILERRPWVILQMTIPLC